ncbi:MAG: FKBP-type peptidyl-prolyl cis-trans isomerase [Phycisphaerales bacterium]
MPTTHPSGVIIDDLSVGTGALCKPGATVKVHYRGTLTSGKEFDSSIGGDPINFPLNNLIEGWQIGIPGMKVGGKRKLTIPWKMGYGEQGSPPAIPPRADLIFEIELLGVR